MEQSKKLTEGALLLGIYVLMLFLAMTIPIFFVIAIFLLSIPFIIYTAKHGFKYALVMTSGAMLFSLFIIPVLAIPLTLLASIGGMMIGHGIHQKASPYETWAQGAFGFVIGMVAIFTFSQFVLGFNLIQEIESMLTDSMQVSMDLMQQFGLQPLTDAEIQLIEQSYRSMLELIPAGVAILAIIMAFISQWLSYKILNRSQQQHLKFPPFREFKLPVAMVWIYFVVIILSLFGQELPDSLGIAVNNVVMLVGWLIVLQGFSFMFFYAHHKGKSNALPIVGIILTLIFPFFFLYLVRILGIIDIGFDLRKRLSEEGKK